MNKESLFNQYIEEIKSLKGEYSSYKLTKTDEYESHCFGYVNNADLSECKELLSSNNWKDSYEVYSKFNSLQGSGKTTNRYFTVLYNKVRNRISMSYFTVGYAYANKKRKYYPFTKSDPYFCYSDKMYSFLKIGKLKAQPRILLGTLETPLFFQFGRIANKIFLNVDFNCILPISYRHYMNAKDQYEVLENYAGVKIPQVLKKHFISMELLQLYKGLKDYNEVNKLCQYISKNPVNGDPLHKFLAKMLFNSELKQWLITDSFNDCIRLNKRFLSLKVTSVKRWQDEHSKRFAMIRAKNTPDFKTKDIYKNALEGFEYEAELINEKKRLVDESVEMGHCVSTYAHKINNGDCAIFAIKYKDVRYTLEIGMLNDSFIVSQLKGRYNASAPQELNLSIENFLKNKTAIAA
jgi:hypothetical protein